MAIDGISPAAVTDKGTMSATTSDDAQLFAQMVNGFLSTGMALANTIVGDAIDAANEDTASS